MQLNRVLKGLMIALPVMAIAARFSNKNISNDGSEDMLSVGIGVDASDGNGNVSSEGRTHLQMQQLQQNNIARFNLDKYDIRSDSTQMLDAHVNFLCNNPSYEVTIEGHAGERGTPEYSISLGECRANTVEMYLQGKDVSVGQIFIVSYGKERLTILSHDEATHSKNRRVILAYRENCMSSSLRRQLLSLSLLVGIAAPWAASAQVPISSVDSGSAEDCVIQLERISDAHSQLLTQFQQQLSNNQSDIDSLCGQTQRNQYQLNRVVERQRQILLQIDSLSNGGAMARSTSGDQSGTMVSTTSTADAGTANAGAPVKSGSVNTDYNAAIALMQDKFRQNDAVVAFQSFIKNYPDSTYLPSTNYWLGQLNYNKGKKGNATYYFTSVVKNYPKSPKATDVMFKVDIIVQDKGDTAKAKAVYQQVISGYPGADNARQVQKHPNAM